MDYGIAADAPWRTGYLDELHTVMIGDSVTGIGASAFEYCDSLTDVYYGGSNFFQLRELGNVLGFEVDFDGDTNTAIVRSVEK